MRGVVWPVFKILEEAAHLSVFSEQMGMAAVALTSGEEASRSPFCANLDRQQPCRYCELLRAHPRFARRCAPAQQIDFSPATSVRARKISSYPCIKMSPAGDMVLTYGSANGRLFVVAYPGVFHREFRPGASQAHL
jgi:hypothetical protein